MKRECFTRDTSTGDRKWYRKWMMGRDLFILHFDETLNFRKFVPPWYINNNLFSFFYFQVSSLRFSYTRCFVSSRYTLVALPFPPPPCRVKVSIFQVLKSRSRTEPVRLQRQVHKFLRCFLHVHRSFLPSFFFSHDKCPSRTGMHRNVSLIVARPGLRERSRISVSFSGYTKRLFLVGFVSRWKIIYT